MNNKMTDDRIMRAVIKGTRTGKIKWKFSNSLHAVCDHATLELRFDVCLWVNGSLIRGERGTHVEFMTMMDDLYREDETFESAIMELESDQHDEKGTEQ